MGCPHCGSEIGHSGLSYCPEKPELDWDLFLQAQDMTIVWELIKRMDTEKYRHRQGFLLRDASAQMMLDHARDEITELEETLAAPDVEELADVFGCLIHFAVRQGWSMADVAKALEEKLKARLTQEEE